METTQPDSVADEARTVKALAALAQPQRLRAFRALVVAGPAGLTPGVIAEQLGIAPSALSFHLKELANAGGQQRAARTLPIYRQLRADNALLGYPT
jgi:predicted ArsR family transcriptional regulator